MFSENYTFIIPSIVIDTIFAFNVFEVPSLTTLTDTSVDLVLNVSLEPLVLLELLLVEFDPLEELFVFVLF